jgi:lipopolysaccharide transport system ATP-binding protein
MSRPVIRVENLGKKFVLRHQAGKGSRYVALRDVLASKAKALFQKNRADATREEFWALKDVSFEIQQGEAVGIIGRNGAGKSTLLKILSRITRPTRGRIEIESRMASLLEVGTGFHPELTGRENIFLNGAILGMGRAEITKKFDEIVAFAEVEKFLDTPVKHYSSGMYMRLAFAIAAHLDPDILIVDEVLAVGDAAFQKKCLGKMQNVSQQEGRTVLFVSHDMGAIRRLCPRAILLQGGQIHTNGDVNVAIHAYLGTQDQAWAISSHGTRAIAVKSVELMDVSGERISSCSTFDRLLIEFTCEATAPIKEVSFAACFNNVNNTRVTSLWSAFLAKTFDVEPGTFKVRFDVPSLSLPSGEYEIIWYVESGGVEIERVDNIKRLTVSYTNKFGYVTEPRMAHGLYVEKFDCEIIH